VWRVIWPGERHDQLGRKSTCLEPHAEQRNLTFTSGNGVRRAVAGKDRDHRQDGIVMAVPARGKQFAGVGSQID
jgi:hypothetical protein